MLTGARILLIRLGGLGDVVFTLPAVNAIRGAFPDAKLTYLTYREFAPVLQGFGEFETVLTLDRAGYKALNPKVILGETVGLISRLVRSRFALAIDFQSFGETAWMTWWSGAPLRWGNVYRPNRSWAYTHPVTRDQSLHPIDYDLAVLRKAGSIQKSCSAQEFSVPETAKGEAKRWFSEHNLEPQRPTLLLHPFTSTPEKNWPLDFYLGIARRGREQGLQIVFGGGPGDRVGLEPARAAGFAVAAGAPLIVSAALALLSTVVVGGDSGLPHLAVAMGRRVVMIMKSVQPGACYPFGHKDWAIVPAGGQPVSSITIDAVWQGCRQALTEIGINRPQNPAAAGHAIDGT